ncbi:hypothetical protein LMH87_006163 [Akanthomyces muscarius]|uniref:Uncharacterized protein n=1 Tax=Akanthomyces muscarius TaxID=2231603 RepID=A0A9W8QNA7_AKAMU|nr:hypothetical protein LMH87_006163 [Akanthomyces muscarius]KAJ4164490.1 hypothetical protein LMH87_006163 [Akanthomyces muscarius]
MAKSRPADVLFLSSPRTLSNLLVKLLSGQTGWEQSTYCLHDAFEYAQSHLSECNVESPAESFGKYLEMLRAGYQDMTTAREGAHEKGHAFFLKSHVMEMTNPSRLFAGFRSDVCPFKFTTELEDSLRPLPGPTRPCYLTRCFYFPSAPDLWRSNAPSSTSLHFTRALFEWYEAATLLSPSTAGAEVGNLSISKTHPVVVDADDILEGDTVQRLAEMIDMDPEQILQKWDAQSTEGLEGLWESTGIDMSKSSRGLDLETKFGSWNELHGVEVGEALAFLTKRQMGDYMWLKSCKI